MGRAPWTLRLTTEQCLCFSLSPLYRAGVFKTMADSNSTWKWPSPDGGDVLSLFMTVVEMPGRAMGLRLESVTGTRFSPVVVPVSTTRPRLGGRRFWFLCPMFRDGVRCGRRCGCLYLPPGAESWGCRLCYNLTYTSTKTHDSRKDRLLHNPDLLTAALKSDDIRQRLLAVGAWTQALARLNRGRH